MTQRTPPGPRLVHASDADFQRVVQQPVCARAARRSAVRAGGRSAQCLSMLHRRSAARNAPAAASAATAPAGSAAAQESRIQRFAGATALPGVCVAATARRAMLSGARTSCCTVCALASDRYMAHGGLSESPETATSAVSAAEWRGSEERRCCGDPKAHAVCIQVNGRALHVCSSQVRAFRSCRMSSAAGEELTAGRPRRARPAHPARRHQQRATQARAP